MTFLFNPHSQDVVEYINAEESLKYALCSLEIKFEVWVIYSRQINSYAGKHVCDGTCDLDR